MSFPGYLFRMVEQGASPAIIAKAARRKDINVNRLNEHGYTPLMCAAARGNLRGLRALLKEPRVKAYECNEKRENALMLAARHNQSQCVKTLLAHSTWWSYDRDMFGLNALEISIVAGAHECTRMLIDAGDEEFRRFQRQIVRAVAIASEVRNKTAIKMLLESRYVAPFLNIRGRRSCAKSVLDATMGIDDTAFVDFVMSFFDFHILVKYTICGRRRYGCVPILLLRGGERICRWGYCQRARPPRRRHVVHMLVLVSARGWGVACINRQRKMPV